MFVTNTISWEAANQRHLSAELARVRETIQRHTTQVKGAPIVDSADSRMATAAPDRAVDTSATSSALETLVATFRLSPFERDLLVLCAGVELEAGFAALCAEAQGDPQRTYPTFSLALAALPNPHWSALTPAASLRYWRMINVESARTLTRSPLRIDERILHYLTGVTYLDERLVALIEPVRHAEALVPSHHAIAAQITRAWSRLRSAPPHIQLCGIDKTEKLSIAAAACEASGLELHRLDVGALPTQAGEIATVAGLWRREAVLNRSALLIECEDLDSADGARTQALARFIEQTARPLVLSVRERQSALRSTTIAIEVGKPLRSEQRSIWHGALGTATAELNGHVDLLVGQFDLSAPLIRAACVEALDSAEEPASADLALRVWDACRTQARPRLDDLAQRIDSSVGWDDLVLPEPQRLVLHDIAAHVRQRTKVYEQWGFADRSRRGLGINALFAGASGTGKTLAAEVLANELRLDLYRIDLSSVVSKYIGETEKNLRRIFDAAEMGGAILLFDEADALFGKRSEVKDSHDRYANIEVSYLLQRMEAYHGLAILTTNMKSALDSAFMRRIRFIIQFPFPDTKQRAAIWRRIFPSATPTDGLDIERLAQLNVPGGNIRNIALNAAFLAADAAQPVRMTHLLRAARGEYTKLEKVLTESEIAGWMLGNEPS